MSEPQVPRKTGRRVRKEPPKPDRLVRRMLLQLISALALFALWLGLCWGMPIQAAQWREHLSGLLTGTQDLWSACCQLGEKLAQGEATADALEDWCVQVFLPASLQPEETNSAGEGTG